MMHELVAPALSLVEEKGKELARLQKALKSLATPETLEAPRKVEEVCKVLAEIDPGTLGLDLDLAALMEAAARDQRERATARRVEFGRELKEKAQAKGMACTLITSDPMEFSLPPFTLSVDLEQNTASLLYARLSVENLPAKPDRILTSLEKNLKDLEGGWSSETFFDALHGAYERELLEAGAPKGERVALTRVLAPVAMAFQNDRFRNDPIAAHYQAYGRVRLAYDLARLRRQGLLQRKGWRLNLGTATGSSTRDKKGVLYVEETPGQGQYYLTLWFTPQA